MLLHSIRIFRKGGEREQRGEGRKHSTKRSIEVVEEKGKQNNSSTFSNWRKKEQKTSDNEQEPLMIVKRYID
jgi:hypothetical protein